MKKKIFLLLITFLLVLPFFIIMAVELPNPIGAQTFQQFLYLLTVFISRLALAIAPIIIIYAGFLFVTAAGNPEKIKIAQKALFWTLAGLIIVLSAWGIVEFFQTIFK